jgi:hypothetical protein
MMQGSGCSAVGYAAAANDERTRNPVRSGSFGYLQKLIRVAVVEAQPVATRVPFGA